MILQLIFRIAMAAPAPDALALIGDVDDDVREAFAHHPAIALQSRDVTDAFLKEAALLARSCDAALDQCLLDDAGLCGVPLAAHVTKQASGVLVLRLAVAATGSVRVVTVDVSGDAANAAARRAVLLQESIAQLVAPGSVGTFIIDAPSGTTVLVDGIERGASPLSRPINGLRPGAHLIELRSPDGGSDARRVSAAAQETVHIVFSPKPLTATALTWGGAGVAAIGLVPLGVGTFFAVQYGAAQATLDGRETSYLLTDTSSDLNDPAVRREVIDAHKRAAESAAAMTPAFLIGSAMVVAGGAALAAGLAWQELFGWSVEVTE